MTRLACLLLAVCLIAGLAQHLTAAPAVDLIIVPGKRIGPVSADASVADFRKAFGAANVKEADVYVADESPEEPGLILFPEDPARRLYLSWKDPEREHGVQQVFIAGTAATVPPRTGKWRLQNGIALGTRVKDMERLNGRPFTLYFTEYDAGSGIASWKGGKLADGFGRNWRVLVEADRASELRISKILSSQNTDLIRFESNSAEMQSSNPWVRSIYVSFEAPAN